MKKMSSVIMQTIKDNPNHRVAWYIVDKTLVLVIYREDNDIIKGYVHIELR